MQLTDYNEFGELEQSVESNQHPDPEEYDYSGGIANDDVPDDVRSDHRLWRYSCQRSFNDIVSQQTYNSSADDSKDKVERALPGQP